MLTPMRGTYEPYELGPRPQLFTDWRLLNPGRVGWSARDGKAAPMLASAPAPSYPY